MGTEMSLIDWSDDLSVEIDVIDAQHKELIVMINRLHSASVSYGGAEEIDTLTDVLLGLIDYIQYHFTTEEKHMILHEYPGYEAHHKEHSQFVAEVTSFSEAFQNGTKGLSEEVLYFLKEWYIRHITLSDVRFGVYLNSRGF